MAKKEHLSNNFRPHPIRNDHGDLNKAIDTRNNDTRNNDTRNNEFV